MFRFALTKLFIVSTISLIVIVAAFYSALPFAIRSLALHHLHSGVHSPLHGIVLPKPSVGLDYIRFEKLALDPDSINTVASLTLLFTPKGLLQGHFKQAILEGVEVIASASEGSTMLGLDGWLGQGGLKQALSLQVDRISLRDSDLTLLTPSYGGISVTLDLSATRIKKEQSNTPLYEFQADFGSEQRYLTLNGKANGSFSAAFINAEMEFERGKVSIPDHDITMTRLSGWGRMAYSPAGLSLVSELRAGGMRLSALPWQNASMTYKVEAMMPEFFVSAHSLGVDGLELSMSQKADEPISTRIFAGNQALWDSYIKLNRIEGEDLDKLVELLAQLNTEIEFE